MKDRDQPSTLLRYSAPTAFIAMTLGSIIWFLFGSIDIVGQLISKPDAISLNKGLFYMLGVSIGLAVLSFVLVYELWLRLTLTEKLSSICTKTSISAVAIMFLLPHIVHYSTDFYLKSHDYEICEEASHQWLHSRTIVYVTNKNICSQLLQNNKTGSESN